MTIYLGGVNYPEPAMGAMAYKTYSIKSPVATHYVPATCEEVQCADFLSGWAVVLDGVLVTPQMEHVARNSGRHFIEQDHPTKPVKMLVFEAGQPCFRAATHRKPNGRPEIFTRRNGDFRTPRTAVTRFKRAEDWRDDFGEHQERLADRIERG